MKEVKNRFKKDKSILMLVWQDAAFSNLKKLPKNSPHLQITFGLFIDETKDAINIGMNCHLDPKSKKIVECKDAFLIPKKVIKKIKVLGELNA